MSAIVSQLEDSGLEVIELGDDAAFARRRLHHHDAVTQMRGIQRLSRALATQPETVLQELVNAAVELCGADSAGISLVRDDATPECFYEWIATAGEYSGFLNAMLPQHPSACGVCLIRGNPQLFRVNQRFFDILGVEAPLITDGLLLPWHADEACGTIFIMAHGRTEAFDAEDCKVMQMLADFAATAVRQRKQQEEIVRQAKAKAAVDMANDLAHQINNPLQSLTNLIYLLTEGNDAVGRKDLDQELKNNLQRLNAVVQKLLALPGSASRSL